MLLRTLKIDLRLQLTIGQFDTFLFLSALYKCSYYCCSQNNDAANVNGCTFVMNTTRMIYTDMKDINIHVKCYTMPIHTCISQRYNIYLTLKFNFHVTMYHNKASA